MDKIWRPKITDNSAMYMFEAYGITEDRRIELSMEMGKMHRSQVGKLTSMHYRVDCLAEFCNTVEEFIYCVHVDTIFLERNFAVLT